MGTRADFYVGRGDKAEWIGSIAYDGDPEDYDGITSSTTEADYREKVSKELASRDDATLPEQGWPWAWDDSGTTDYAIAFDAGRVFHTDSMRSSPEEVWVLPEVERDDNGFPLEHSGIALHPNMAHLRRLAPPGSTRSGFMLFGFPK